MANFINITDYDATIHKEILDSPAERLSIL